jgi:phage-related protein
VPSQRKEGAPLNLFDLYAKITLDDSEYQKGIDDAGKKTSSFADKLKTGLAAAAKVGVAAIGAAAAGIAALTKASVENYAEYEQLVGGVDTLFKQASDTVQQYAANAYKTAGMSANEYMNTVTSFSASLIQSLGGDTEKAAVVADQAITDMSDNANKMGTSIDMIQNAYQGFAKQNFTMLDNLKLGYGGTKEEMERLLKDAQKISGIKYDISSFADITEAIHVMQEKMGIAGTTAAEASETIEGSINSMKSAWSNLVTGLADENSDLDKLINNFVDSTATAAKNIIPRVEQTLIGVGTLISKLAPVIGEAVPRLVTNVLPSLLSAGVKLVSGIVEGIASSLPQVLETGTNLLSQLTTGIENGLPDMMSRLPQIIDDFLNFITENLPSILEKGVEMLNSLVNGIINSIPQLVGQLPKIIKSFTTFISQNLPTIIQSGINILLNLIKGIMQAIPQLVASLPELINAIINGLASLYLDLMRAGGQIVQGIIDGIAAAWNGLVSWFNGLWDSLFGNRSVSVNVNQTSSRSVNGSHASGLDYVPFDGYIAELHKGEMVVPAKQAKQLRGNSPSEGININVYGAQGQDVNQLADIVMYKIQNAFSRREAARA